MPYWVTFSEPVEHEGKRVRALCVDTDHGEARAREVAAERGPVASVAVLPYPATPRINDSMNQESKYGRCPSFCYTPEQCKGNSCCRKSYACSE